MKTQVTKQFQKNHDTMDYHHGIAAADKESFRARNNAKPMVVKRSVCQEAALYIN